MIEVLTGQMQADYVAAVAGWTRMVRGRPAPIWSNGAGIEAA